MVTPRYAERRAVHAEDDEDEEDEDDEDEEDDDEVEVEDDADGEAEGLLSDDFEPDPAAGVLLDEEPLLSLR